MATQTEMKQRRSRQNTSDEGETTRMTETVTSKIPSGTYLTAAVASMVASAALQAAGRQRLSLFIGQWAPSILIMGLYNKLVKVAGSG